MKTTLENTLKEADETRNKIHAEWLKSVQAIADKFQVEIATGHLSDTWQVNSGLGKDDFRALCDDEKNPALLELEALDERTHEYGVGPSNMERFKPRNEYEAKAQDFLAKHNLKFRATLSDSKAPPWKDEGEKCGHHYRVTISRHNADQMRECALCGPMLNWTCPKCVKRTTPRPLLPRLTFDFWGSISDAESGKHPDTYEVLACISSDVCCPDTFAEFCADYGYESDSIKSLQTFNSCSRFAKRLRAFFTEAELSDLSEIR